MAKLIINLREELRRYKFDNGLLQKIDCSRAETKKFIKLIKSNQSLPDDVFQYTSPADDPIYAFYRIHTYDFTENEIAEYLAYKQLDLLKTIKGYLMFFVILTIIGMIGAFILLIQ